MSRRGSKETHEVRKERHYLHAWICGEMLQDQGIGKYFIR